MIVTALSLYFHLPIHVAIAASLVSVIATSIAGALRYVKQRIADVQLGMFLEMATTTGALVGAFIGVMLNAYVLSLIFGAFLLYTAANSLISGKKRKVDGEQTSGGGEDPNGISDRLMRRGEYYDKALMKNIRYIPVRPLPGALVVSLAGLAAGLLGIGGGVINVAAMNSIMKVPMKVSIATSQFMIAVTAATGAIVYFIAGGINVYVVAPAALGTLLGSTLGSVLMNRLPIKVIKTIFLLLLIYLGYQMIAKGILMGFGIGLPGII
ncbi:MAG: hypothetical protein B7Z63_04430 [Ignavibacteriae bacterium 37-53-5]|nr:MAG: hypothetical protein B7Z63_04430 [Ignavibacteriae bacterium 37-53-5]